jgi:MATE family multidrug resistance protein
MSPPGGGWLLPGRLCTFNARVVSTNRRPIATSAAIWPAELRAALWLAGPIVLGFVGHRMMGIVDTAIAGKIGTDAQAGLGLGTSYFWTLAAVFLGILMGLEPFFSQASGRNDEAALTRYLRQGVWLATVLSLAAVAVVLAGAWAYVRWAPASAARDAFAGYVFHVVWCLPAVALSFLLQRFWQARQIVMPFTLFVFVGAGTHITTALALGLGRWGLPAWGPTGLGVAASLSRYVMLLCGVLYTWRRLRNFGGAWVQPDWPVLRQFLRIGGPTGGQVALEVSAFFVVTFLASTLGTVPMAAHHVCFNLATFTFMFAMGTSAAASVRVGTNLGQGRAHAARVAGWLGIGMGAGVMGLFGVVYLLVRRPLLGIFTQDAAVLAAAVPVLAVAGLFQIADGTQVTAGGALRGLGVTRIALVANLVGHFAIGLPVGLICCYGLKLGVTGLWIGLAAGLFTAAAILLGAWRRAAAEVEQMKTVG